MEKMTIHDACEGKAILLTDRDMNLVFAWNGSATFTVYQESGLEYRECDGWTTDVIPVSMEEATARCRARLLLIYDEAAAAELLNAG